MSSKVKYHVMLVGLILSVITATALTFFLVALPMAESERNQFIEDCDRAGGRHIVLDIEHHCIIDGADIKM